MEYSVFNISFHDPVVSFSFPQFKAITGSDVFFILEVYFCHYFCAVFHTGDLKKCLLVPLGIIG